MKRKIALLLITGICLANTVPCFASPSMKVSVSSSEENQYSTLPDGDTLQKGAWRLALLCVSVPPVTDCEYYSSLYFMRQPYFG
jgi:hypothetical protein